MNRSEETDKLSLALLAAQGEFPIVDKSANNPFYKSRYAPYDGLKKMVGPFLTKNGIIVEHSPDIEYKWQASGEGYETQIAFVTVTTRITHAASGQWKEIKMTSPCEKVNTHGVQAVITYVKRNNFILILDVAVGDEDDDGNEGMKAPQSNNPTQNQRQSRPPSTKQETKPPATKQEPIKEPAKPGTMDAILDQPDQAATIAAEAAAKQQAAQTDPMDEPWNKARNTVENDPSTTQNGTRPMSDVERARVGLINRAEYEMLKDLISKNEISKEAWKGWLRLVHNLGSIQEITSKVYPEILDVLKVHPDTIKNYKGVA